MEEGSLGKLEEEEPTLMGMQVRLQEDEVVKSQVWGRWHRTCQKLSREKGGAVGPSQGETYELAKCHVLGPASPQFTLRGPMRQDLLAHIIQMSKLRPRSSILSSREAPTNKQWARG